MSGNGQKCRSKQTFPICLHGHFFELTYHQSLALCWKLPSYPSLFSSVRPYWRCYYSNTDAVIYVVDSNDRDRMGISKSELVAMLEVSRLVLNYSLKTLHQVIEEVFFMMYFSDCASHPGGRAEESHPGGICKQTRYGSGNDAHWGGKLSWPSCPQRQEMADL